MIQRDLIYDCTPRCVYPPTLRASRFTGKERDTESGLDYFGGSYHESNMGRFMSPDWAITISPIPLWRYQQPSVVESLQLRTEQPPKQE
jgi:RHS repeat-associated protein